MADSNLGKLMWVLAANTSTFERDWNRAGRIAKRKGQEIQATVALIGKAALATGGAAVGLVALAKNAAMSADAMAKTAKFAGISAEALQEYRFVAERGGTSTKLLDEGVRRLNRRLGLAAQGGGPAIKMFEELGISIRDSTGQVRDNESVLEDIIAKLGETASESEKAAIASAFFGDDAGPKLATALGQGIAAVQELRSEKRQLGIISNEAAAAAEKTASSWLNATDRFETSSQVLLLNLLPAVNKSIEGLGLLTDVAIDAGEAIADIAKSMGLLDKSKQDDLRLITEQWVEAHEVLMDVEHQLRMVEQSHGKGSSAARQYRARVAELQEEFNRLTRQRDKARGIVKQEREEQARANQTTQQATIAIKELNLEALIPAKRGLEDLRREVTQYNERLQNLRDFLNVMNPAQRELTALVADAKEAYEKGDISLTDYVEAVQKAKKQFNDFRIEGIELIDTQEILNKKVGDESVKSWEALEKQVEKNKKQMQEMAQIAGDALGTLTSLPQQVSDHFGRVIAALPGGAGITNFLSNAATGAGIGQGFGQSGVGGALGAVVGSFIPGVGTVIGSVVGSLLEGIFGDEDDPRFRLVNSQIDPNGPYGGQYARRSALGFTVSGQQITEGTPGADILNRVVDFDRVIAQILGGRSGQIQNIRDRLLAGGETSRLFEGGAVNVEQILRARFGDIANSLTGPIGTFVRQFTDDVEEGVSALGAIVGTLDNLEDSPVEKFAEMLEQSGETTSETMQRLGSDLQSLNAEAMSSVEGMTALGVGLEQYNAFVVQALAGVEQARRAIGSTTSSTREQLIMSTLSQQDQFTRLTERAQSLAGGIGGLGTAEQVSGQVSLINQLISQAFGIANPAQQQQLLNNFLPFLDTVEGQAQTRLDQIQQDIEERSEAERAAIQESFDAAAVNIQGAVSTGIGQGVGQFVPSFGQAVQQFANSVSPLNINVTYQRSEVG